ncbi:hypothetical protein ALC53_00961 [Atta colombica]|uniref:Uncharacterized protein n=1 Tax=Atta colombica TaxID=520822 RepID=A0A195BW47_9HYME|nr:hypothetical protein ALC53_00961 [Atta colombica]
MITQTKDLVKDPIGDMSTYERPSDVHHLSMMTRIIGVCTAIENNPFNLTNSEILLFLRKKTVYILTIYFHRNEDSLCSCCWFSVLAATRGWRRALFYLPLSCILAWRPNKLWLSYVAAGLLAVLSLLHIASSALERRDPCQSNIGTDSVGESLLNSRQENYDRFEEVLDQDAVLGTATARYDTNDGPPGLVNPMRIASLNRGRVKLPHCLSP